MLPNTPEQWENDNGKSVQVNCTKPEDNSTDAQNGTSSQVSLNGEQVLKHSFLFLDFLIIICFLCSDYNTSDSEDLFADDAYESENTYDLIDNQEAYNASGNWSLYEMEEGNFNLHTFYTHI